MNKDTPKRPRVGTGMPATIHLEAFGNWLYDAFHETAYLVGSAAEGKKWRDVDIRMMLDDDVFAAMFPNYAAIGQNDAKWALMCAAIGELAKKWTGLPVDFQFQSTTAANKLYSGRPRHPLALYPSPRSTT